MNARLSGWANAAATWIERLLALAVLVGVIVVACANTAVLAKMDWGNAETAYDFVYRVLALVIMVELSRTLVTHDPGTIVDLLAFVIARKMLTPDLSTLDMLLSVTAFAGLLAARRWLLGRA